MTAVLVISPHAMDEALGCGGTMARHAAAGDRVDTLVLFGDGSGIDAKRRIAAPLAAEALGAGAPRFAGLPENRSDTLPLIEIIGVIERAIKEMAPEILYLPHGGNLNIDHQTAFRAAITAARPVPGYPVRTLYAYEVPSSTEWAPPSSSPPSCRTDSSISARPSSARCARSDTMPRKCARRRIRARRAASARSQPCAATMSALPPQKHSWSCATSSAADSRWTGRGRML